MAICCINDCGKKAQWQVKFHVWAKITPIAERHSKNCLKMLSSLILCDDCKNSNKVSPDTLFSVPEGRERISATLDKLKMEPPDLDHPSIDYEPIADEPIDIRKIVEAAERRGQPTIKG